MEERIIDEEIGRKIKVKRLVGGGTDVVDALAEGEETGEQIADGQTTDGEGVEAEEEELTFELPDLEEDDEDLVGLSPEEALALRKKKEEEAAERRRSYEAMIADGETQLAQGAYGEAEVIFEKALLLDDVATEASVGYWRAKTEDFSNPDVLIAEYVEAGYENLEYDLGYEATEIIKRDYKAEFERRYNELVSEELPLQGQVQAAQERRRAILKPRRRRSAIAFAIAAIPFLAALIATIILGLKNFTVKDNAYMVPTFIAGGIAFVTFIVFGVFTNKFINSCRIYRANERVSATDEGARLEEIAEYKELYLKFM